MQRQSLLLSYSFGGCRFPVAISSDQSLGRSQELIVLDVPDRSRLMAPGSGCQVRYQLSKSPLREQLM
jgi:hypothetical protein